MTLAEAFDHHPEDRAWLARYGLYCPEDWDLTVEVTHFHGPAHDAYLGTDGETVFEVHGQAEPILRCDADYWTMRQEALTPVTRGARRPQRKETP